VYGFHDLRRGFATVNARSLGAEALQRLMRHKSYTTTQLYVNMANQLNDAVKSLHVPDALKKASGGFEAASCLGSGIARNRKSLR
jgi:integrase